MKCFKILKPIKIRIEMVCKNIFLNSACIKNKKPSLESDGYAVMAMQ